MTLLQFMQASRALGGEVRDHPRVIHFASHEDAHVALKLINEQYTEAKLEVYLNILSFPSELNPRNLQSLQK